MVEGGNWACQWQKALFLSVGHAEGWKVKIVFLFLHKHLKKEQLRWKERFQSNTGEIKAKSLHSLQIQQLLIIFIEKAHNIGLL